MDNPPLTTCVRFFGRRPRCITQGAIHSHPRVLHTVDCRAQPCRECRHSAVDKCGNVENSPNFVVLRRVPASKQGWLVDNPVNNRATYPQLGSIIVGDSIVHISTRLTTTTVSFLKFQGALFITGWCG